MTDAERNPGGAGATPGGVAGWPVAELDDVRRMRVLAASIPGAAYAAEYVDIPFERVWAFVADLETSLPALITDIRSFRVHDRSAAGEHLTARAVGLLGNRGRFDVTLRPGWCLMQSRFVVGGMAAVPQGGGTLFAGCGGLRVPGSRLLMAAVGDRGAQRIVRRLWENCGG
jgi:hypothetical protein